MNKAQEGWGRSVKRKWEPFAWVGIVVGLLTIGEKAWGVSSYVTKLADRLTAAEKSADEQKEDLKYIRGRVDAIYDRLPPCHPCKD